MQNQNGSFLIRQGLSLIFYHYCCKTQVKDPFDPNENISAGTRYLAQLLNMYDGDLSLALAAYNAGMGNVNKYGGIPPFEETQNFVKKVTAIYHRLQQENAN